MKTKPCSKCGDDRVVGQLCNPCRNAYTYKWNHGNKGAVRAAQRKWANKTKVADPELWRKRIRERARRLYWSNIELGRAKSRAKTAARKAAMAMPMWADKDAIRKIYEECPDGYQVDHIIPLRGENICGLHVEGNLQYLTIEENSRKRNHFV